MRALSGVAISGVVISFMVFSGVVISGMVFSGVVFSDVVFSGAWSFAVVLYTFLWVGEEGEMTRVRVHECVCER